MDLLHIFRRLNLEYFEFGVVSGRTFATYAAQNLQHRIKLAFQRASITLRSVARDIADTIVYYMRNKILLQQ